MNNNEDKISELLAIYNRKIIFLLLGLIALVVIVTSVIIVLLIGLDTKTKVDKNPHNDQAIIFQNFVVTTSFLKLDIFSGKAKSLPTSNYLYI